MESTENVYHVTRQNIHFAHAPYSKGKNQRWYLRCGLMIKHVH